MIGVEVAVQIDEARGQNQPLCWDDLRGLAVEVLRHGGIPALGQRDVSRESRRARPVNDRGLAEEKIVHSTLPRTLLKTAHLQRWRARALVAAYLEYASLGPGYPSEDG